MKVVSLEEADSKRLSQFAPRASTATLIVTKNGEPLFSIKRLSKDDRERMALANNSTFIAIIEASRRSLRETGGLSMEDVCRKHGLKLPTSKPRRREVAITGTRKKKGKPVFEITALSGQDMECLALANDPKFMKKLADSERAYFRDGGVSSEQLLTELGLSDKKPKPKLRSTSKTRPRTRRTAEATTK